MGGYVICLDESGSFRLEERGVNFVAGFLFELGEREAEPAWAQKCASFCAALQAFCAKNSLSFPEALHSTANDRSVHQLCNDWLGEYIRNLNHFGPVCRPFLMIQHGGQSYAGSAELVSDAVGANLYENMLFRLLSRLAFHVVPRNSRLLLDLPTRQHVVEGAADSPDFADECLLMEELGYARSSRELIAGGKTRVCYSVVSAGNQRVLFNRYMAEHQRQDIDISIRSLQPRSISYHSGAAESNGGRYLADMLCEYVKQYLYEYRLSRRRLRTENGCLALRDIAKELTEALGAEPLLFEYGAEDGCAARALTAIDDKLAEQLLRAVAELAAQHTPTGRYYVDFCARAGFLSDQMTAQSVAFCQSVYFQADYAATLAMLQWLYDAKLALELFTYTYR